MAGIEVKYEILNQSQTPAFFADIFANRPAAGFIGRIFISTDTLVFYRDTGTTWLLVGGTGSGTITGTGTNGQISFWTGSASISGNNNLQWNSTNNFLSTPTLNLGGATYNASYALNVIGDSIFSGDVNANSFTGRGAGLTSLPSNTALYPTFNQNTTGTATNITASSNNSLTTLTSLSLPYAQVTGTPSLSGYITSVNGTSPILSTGGTTPSISIPQATTSNSGYLSSTDWNTFNGKQAGISLTTSGTSGAATFSSNNINIPQYQAAGTYVTSVTGTSPMVSSGGTTPAISLPLSNSTTSGYLSSTDWNTFNGKQAGISLTTSGTSGAATFSSNNINIPQYQAAGTYVTSVTGTSPMVSSGGTTPAISLPLSNSTTSGYLSSTDWTTFNNKQNALTNPVTGTGTTNYLPKFTGSSTIGNSQIFDNGTSVGIGTTSPSSRLTVQDAGNTYPLNISGNNQTNGVAIGTNSSNVAKIQGYTRTFSATNNIAIQPDGGNLLIGTTTDAGYKLDVNGTGRFNGGNVLVTNVASSGYAFTSVATNYASGTQIYTGFKIGAPLDNLNVAGVDLRAYTNYAQGSGTEFRLYVNNTSNVLTEALRIASTGEALFSNTLGINGTADNVKSGTYTPTVAGFTNISSAEIYPAQYIRVGDVVTVSGRVTPVVTTGTVNTFFTLSLPIVSGVFSQQGQAAGCGMIYNNAAVSDINAAISANTTTTNVIFQFLPLVYGGSRDIYYQFTYKII